MEAKGGATLWRSQRQETAGGAHLLGNPHGDRVDCQLATPLRSHHDNRMLNPVHPFRRCSTGGGGWGLGMFGL
ncbi:hypothetical protein E2562_036814 [Oryza meyeriana var. granulata]|uniref:Uncharacterized protein n=1 Tax=Oryza meyeriana var. granulata TaxID=110450 RepID=A0A6G1E7H5_9ORYZ|nr:hypothetical protein E2562_036814 [Oryza meyeriana var. granulata]